MSICLFWQIKGPGDSLNRSLYCIKDIEICVYPISAFRWIIWDKEEEMTSWIYKPSTKDKHHDEVGCSHFCGEAADNLLQRKKLLSETSEIKLSVSVILLELGRCEFGLEDLEIMREERKKKKKSYMFESAEVILSPRCCFWASHHTSLRSLCNPSKFVRSLELLWAAGKAADKQVEGEGCVDPVWRNVSRNYMRRHKMNIKVKHHKARVDGRKTPAANDKVVQKFSFSPWAWGYDFYKTGSRNASVWWNR